MYNVYICTWFVEAREVVIQHARIVECAPEHQFRADPPSSSHPEHCFPSHGFFCLPSLQFTQIQVSFCLIHFIPSLGNFSCPLTCSQSNNVALWTGMFCSCKSTYPCMFATTPTNVVHLVSLFQENVYTLRWIKAPWEMTARCGCPGAEAQLLYPVLSTGELLGANGEVSVTHFQLSPSSISAPAFTIAFGRSLAPCCCFHLPAEWGWGG